MDSGRGRRIGIVRCEGAEVRGCDGPVRRCEGPARRREGPARRCEGPTKVRGPGAKMLALRPAPDRRTIAEHRRTIAVQRRTPRPRSIAPYDTLRFLEPIVKVRRTVCVCCCLLALSWAALQAAGSGRQPRASQPAQPSVAGPRTDSVRTTLDQYCVTCHNSRVKTADLALDDLDVTRISE